MENNANYAIVGAVATALLVALVGFVYWFAAPSSNVVLKPFDIVFTGTVSGISRGTEVQFNGIRVGQVTDIALDPQNSDQVVARIEVTGTAPVRADTRVTTGIQGLTGGGTVQLMGGTPDAGDPPVAPGRDAPTLFAEVSDFQSIIDSLASTANNASTIVARVNTLLETNDDRLNATMENIEAFSTALASNSQGVEDFLGTISEVGTQIGPMATEITDLSSKLGALVDAVPPEEVSQVVANVTTFSDALARNSEQIDVFFSATSVLSRNLTELTDGLSASVAVIDQVAAEIDPAIIGRVLDNADRFSQTLGSNSDSIDTIVANVDTIVTNVNAVSDSLLGSAEKVNAILDQVNDTVSSAEGEGMFNDIAQAAQSVRALADQLNASTARIAAGLNDFTSSGLSSYSALAVDARETLQRFDRVVRNLENNPQGLIFGGETVRDYNKQ